MNLYIPASYFDNWKPENQTVSNTKAHPHAEVIKAWADGIPCQVRHSVVVPWKNIPPPSAEPSAPAWYPFYQYRIKPETIKIKYRVALFEEPSGEPFTTTADSEKEEFEFQVRKEFIKWLTDWIEVEVNE